MTLEALQQVPFWPYVALIVFGFLPSEVWRLLAVVLSRGLSETSPIIEWVRLVATALLCAVVVKLLLAPSGALAAVPLLGRLGAIAVAAAVFMATRRNLIAGVIAGEAVLVATVWWQG
ncbi:AzlD domain-containing protein [Alsobacter sp. R-9]